MCHSTTENICYSHCLTYGVDRPNGLDMYILSPVIYSQRVLTVCVWVSVAMQTRKAYKRQVLNKKELQVEVSCCHAGTLC